MNLEYSELCVLLTNLIPMTQSTEETEEIKGMRDKWNQKKLNSAVQKLEAEATRLRNIERKEEKRAT